MGIATIKAEELPQGAIYFIIGKRVYADGTTENINYRNSDLEAVKSWCRENHIFYKMA